MTVHVIHRWARGDIGEPVMSASSGPKDYFSNTVYELFSAHSKIAAVLLVCSQYRGGAFLLLVVNEAGLMFDMARQEVVVAP